MSQCHTYLPKARCIKVSRGVTIFLENVTQRHTFSKKSCIMKGFSKKERHTYSCLAIECWGVRIFILSASHASSFSKSSEGTLFFLREYR